LMNDWPAGNRLPPIKELAKELGTGQMNTYRAVQELVKDGFLISRPKMGTFINNDCADMRSKLEKIIDNSPERKNLFSNKWIQIITSNSNSDSVKDFYRRALTPFINEISEFNPRITEETCSMKPDSLTEFNESDILVVFNPNNGTRLICGPSQILIVISTNPRCTVAMTDRFDFFTVDDIQGSMLAGSFLKSRGWKDICFLGRKLDDSSELEPTTVNRLRGLSEGLGQQILPEHILYCSDYRIASGAQIVSDWLKLNPRPSAIFAACDELAIGFISGALSHNLKPGRDYQIMGFDGLPLGKELGIGTLTSVNVPLEKIGTMAAKMLIERLNDPHIPSRRISLGCNLIEGNTVALNPDILPQFGAAETQKSVF